MSEKQRIAIIDLGSNTNRLIVMETDLGFSYQLVDEVREVVRLHHGMTEKGLSEDAIARGMSTLRLYKDFCQQTHVTQILATATSAVREAANGREFLRRIQDELGISIQLLKGEEEAYYDSLGALNEIELHEGVVLDIGGGSIQLSDIQKRNFYQGSSLSLGALALTERFVENDPISKGEYHLIKDEIERQLDGVTWLPAKTGQILVGLGGTIRNLALIEAERQQYPLFTQHGFTLDKASVKKSISYFREHPLQKRQQLPGLSSDRADIILPGAMVLLAVMNRLDVDRMQLSVNGLREGVFFELFWDHLDPPVIPSVRKFSALNLARNYEYEKEHANHVRFLAGRLFDQLTPLHNCGPKDRELLSAAALLHDLGRIIGYSSHHKHTQTLLEYNGLPGYTPRETALIALLCRYHRKGLPDIADYKLLLDKNDQKLLLQLSAILRLAECLERGRNANITDTITTWDEDQLRVTLIANQYPAVELWQAGRNASPLMAEAFKKEILFDSFSPPS
ncbi:MAG: HD domain-containing protein [Anaerolineales bacterium]|jgi:exopolyphosphatase/guanosine-5'-triphosphate,3'-diphosphate pyrophosphatase